MLQGIGGILPSHIVAVRLGHHAGTTRLTGIGDERLVNLVDLVVFLAGGKLVGHLLEHSVALGIHTEGVVIDRLGIKQVVRGVVVRGYSSMTLQNPQLFLGTLHATHLDIHLQTLLGGQIVTSRLLGRRQTAGGNNLVGTTQQIEGLLIEVLLVVECCGLGGTLYTLQNLSLVGIVVEGVDIGGARQGYILLYINAFCLLLQIAFLCFLGKSHRTTEKQIHE